ncbi:hypothetical protein ABMA27_007808 [Loxostege sticticalis]|uniref:Regulatory protein zeste n=1 Tax=Loxostege sticticalis TaxID=481309 RepID=A0ABR3HCX7_LOXSC
MIKMTATHEQIEMLLQFLQEHTGLAKGHINSPDARAHSKRLWAELTDQLKSLGGAVKTTKQWQKDQLLNEEFKENIASNGQDEVPSTSASASTAASATAASATVPGTAFAAASASGTAAAFAAASGAASAAADPPSAPSTSRLPPRRPRLRFRRQPEDVRSQLVRLEERKIDELAGLRQEVKELTSTLRECLEHFKKQN